MSGGLTWAVDSILPALVLHSAGDVVVLVRWWATGLPEWQISAAPALVRDRGVDPPLLATVAIFTALAALTAWSYQRLRSRLAAAA